MVFGSEFDHGLDRSLWALCGSQGSARSVFADGTPCGGLAGTLDAQELSGGLRRGIKAHSSDLELAIDVKDFIPAMGIALELESQTDLITTLERRGNTPELSDRFPVHIFQPQYSDHSVVAHHITKSLPRFNQTIAPLIFQAFDLFF